MYLYSNIEKLKKRKIELGWSNERLAEESKIPVEIINAILSGIMKDIKQETMDALVDAMDLEYYKIEDWGAGVSIIREPGAYSVRKDERATLETYYALPDYPRVEPDRWRNLLHGGAISKSSNSVSGIGK